MTWQYTHPFWTRTWRIDEEGIHEKRTTAAERRIGWDELDRLDSRSARSLWGARITLVLGPRESEEFFAHATREWKRSFPDRVVANANRIRKTSDRAVYFWLPLFTFLPGIAFFFLYGWMGFPESMEKALFEIQRCMFTGVIIWCATVWLYWRELKRRDAQAPS